MVRLRSTDVFLTLSQVGVAVCVASILWVVDAVVSIQKDVAVLVATHHSSNSQFSKHLDDFKDFSKEPRFTRSNFNYDFVPLKLRVDRHYEQIMELKHHHDNGEISINQHK